MRDEPVVRVRRVYHRNDPILTMASPMRPPTDVSFAKCIVQSGMIWDEIESAGLSGVKGVWCHEAGAIRMFIVVSIEQMHPGHAQQAGMLVAGCHSGNYAGRWVVVVDGDIDPTNLDDVIWAMSTRCDPVRRHRIHQARLVDAARSDAARAAVGEHPRDRERLPALGTGGIEFPEVASASPERRKAVEEKWARRDRAGDRAAVALGGLLINTRIGVRFRRQTGRRLLTSILSAFDIVHIPVCAPSAV